MATIELSMGNRQYMDEFKVVVTRQVIERGLK